MNDFDFHLQSDEFAYFYEMEEEFNEKEREHLFYARRIADCFLAELKDNSSEEMISLATGEVIDQGDLERLKDILSAMEDPHWEIVK